ncbi:hypothetical protein HK104_000068 [Borealophlyctis nickersoniae]|nr:hypothetical protein HK104_000068 [Borealophlyctis nickersoniae]
MIRLDLSRPQFSDHCSRPKGKSPLPSSQKRIPRYVHFVHCLRVEPCDFGLLEYLVIRAAHQSIKPSRIFFHHRTLPSNETNPWWALAQLMLSDLIQTEDVTEIFGNPVHHTAHKADVVRLRALQKYGGIYLDMDVVAYRSFDPLLHHDFVMGLEGVVEPWVGLCNAVILSSPNSSFLADWYASYATFDASHWSDHSVLLPYQMSKHPKHKGDLCVLPTTSFFWPAYFNEHLAFIHEENEYEFFNDFQYAYHIYHPAKEKYLRDLTPEMIRSHNTSFMRLLRRFLPDDL